MRKAYSEARIRRVRQELSYSTRQAPVFSRMRQISTLRACHRPCDHKSFCGNSSKKIDFAHRLDVVARPGSRELCAFKIPRLATPKTSKTRFRKNSANMFFGLGNQFFVISSRILEELNNFRCQNQLPRGILLQIYRFLPPSDP